MIKNGKLFGKINLFDLLVILLVFVLIFAVGMKFLSKKETVANTVDATYELKIESVRDVTVNAFHKGDSVYHFDTNETIGTIEDIRTVAATDPMNTLDGKAIEAPLENRYDVIITVKTTAVRHETGNLMVGKVKLVEGVQFRAATLLANCQAKVQNLQWN